MFGLEKIKRQRFIYQRYTLNHVYVDGNNFMNCLIASWKTVVNKELDYLLIILSWRMSFAYSVTFKTETKTNIPSL